MVSKMAISRTYTKDSKVQVFFKKSFIKKIHVPSSDLK